MKFTFEKIIVENDKVKMLFSGAGIFSSKAFTIDELERFEKLYPSNKKQYNRARHEYNRTRGELKRKTS